MCRQILIPPRPLSASISPTHPLRPNATAHPPRHRKKQVHTPHNAFFFILAMYAPRNPKGRGRKTKLPSKLYNKTLLAHINPAAAAAVANAAATTSTPSTSSNFSAFLPQPTPAPLALVAPPSTAPKEALALTGGQELSTSMISHFTDDVDGSPRHVTRQGLTLRQLYQLKKDACAWHLVECKCRQDQAASDLAARTKQHAEKQALSRCYDQQVHERQVQEEASKTETRAWARQLQQQVEEELAAETAARTAHLTQMAAYRSEFCEDMERSRLMKMQQRQKKIVGEQEEIDRARRLATKEAQAIQCKREANLERMKGIQLEIQQQMQDRAHRKKEEAEEIKKLEREWVAAQDKKDLDRHAAFQKIVTQQEAKEASFSMTTQEVLKRQLEEDERRASKYREQAEVARVADDKRRETARRAAARAQLEALDLEIRLQAERKQQLKAEEQVMAQEMLSRDKTAYEKDLDKQRAARSAVQEHKRLLAVQIKEQQQQNQRIVVGFVQPSEMALNKSLFQEIGYVSPDPKAPPLQYLQASGTDPRKGVLGT